MPPTVDIESLAEAAIESERLLLGLCLLEPEQFRRMELAAEDFGMASHRTVFAMLNELDANAESWDSLSLTESLRARGKLEDAGGPALIADLTTGVPRNTAVLNHIQMVRKASL